MSCEVRWNALLPFSHNDKPRLRMQWPVGGYPPDHLQFSVVLRTRDDKDAEKKKPREYDKFTFAALDKTVPATDMFPTSGQKAALEFWYLLPHRGMY